MIVASFFSRLTSHDGRVGERRDSQLVLEWIAPPLSQWQDGQVVAVVERVAGMLLAGAGDGSGYDGAHQSCSMVGANVI